MRNRSGQVDRWGLEFPYRLENFLRLLNRPGIAPPDPAHFLEMEILRERRRRRYRVKSKKPVDVIRRFHDEVAIPPHHLRRVFERPEHRPAVHGMHRLPLEQKRRHHPEIPSAAAHRPEQIRIFLRARCNKSPIGQHHLHSQQIVDRQPVPPGQVPNPPPPCPPRRQTPPAPSAPPQISPPPSHPPRPRTAQSTAAASQSSRCTPCAPRRNPHPRARSTPRAN